MTYTVRQFDAGLSEGEPMVHRWISEAHVVAEQWRTIDSSPLQGAANAPTLPLLKVLFLDSRWRSGTQFMLSPLDPASLLGLLFENGFREGLQLDCHVITLGACAITEPGVA